MFYILCNKSKQKRLHWIYIGLTLDLRRIYVGSVLGKKPVIAKQRFRNETGERNTIPFATGEASCRCWEITQLRPRAPTLFSLRIRDYDKVVVSFPIACAKMKHRPSGSFMQRFRMFGDRPTLFPCRFAGACKGQVRQHDQIPIPSVKCDMGHAIRFYNSV